MQLPPPDALERNCSKGFEKYHSRNHLQNKVLKHSLKAFTLAEVLIALVVIGVIAAITIPRLIANYRAEALYTQLMQANSIVQNGAKAMKLDNVDLDEIMSNRDYNQLFKYFKTGTCKTPANEKEAKYYNYYGNAPASGAAASDLLYPVCLANGMMLWLGILRNYTNNWSDSGASIIAIDINGWGKKPDRYGKDVFFWVYSSKVDGLIPTGKSANIIATSGYYTKCPGTTNLSEAGIGCTSTALANKDYFKKF